MKYRAEIDGLRTVAVVPVILFHAGFSIFSGGFVGVDVFFVISGFLITTILIGEIEAGRFSILRFYERRARRILPALFFMIACTLPFAWAWMLPNAFEDYAQSLIAVMVFASNILFWRESGYFEAAAEEKPLLHTWSLAVEEQYYMLFPLFLLLVWRFGRQPVFYMILAASIVSLALTEWGWRYQPTFNFYLLPTRAWELFAGSLCAFLQVQHGARSNNAASGLGLVMVLFSIFAFDSSTPFPSLYALVPVIGTALILLYGRSGTWAASFLQLKPMVWIGLISYSAYLWHQPLFAFARIRSVTTPEPWLMGVLALASIGLAWVSYRFVETPFRKSIATRTVVIAALAGTAAYGVIGLVGHVLNGIPQRHNTDLTPYLQAAESENKKRQICREGAYEADALIKDACWYSQGEFKVLFWGDSHIDTLPDSVAKLDPSIGVYHTAFGACPPIVGLTREDRLTPCDQFNEHIFRFAQEEQFDAIVLGARWRLYADGTGFDNHEGGHDPFTARYGLPGGDPDTRRSDVIARYATAVKELSAATGVPVLVVEQIPEAGWNVPKALAKTALFGGDPSLLSTDHGLYKKLNGEFNDAFAAVEGPKVVRIRPEAIFCDTMIPGRCANAYGGEIFYKDEDHLNRAGSNLLAAEVIKALNALR